MKSIFHLTLERSNAMTNKELGDYLDDIRRRHGQLTREIVLDEATDPDSPLHKYFEWDDDRASHQYRLAQAGTLLRIVKLPPMGEKAHDVRRFLAVRASGVSRADYVPTTEVLADPVMSAIVLRQMRREWHDLRRRWQHMTEFQQMILTDLNNAATDVSA
jgi:hypothetical protein